MLIVISPFELTNSSFEKVKQINPSMEEHGDTCLNPYIILLSFLINIKRLVECYYRLVAQLPINITLINVKMELYINNSLETLIYQNANILKLFTSFPFKND